MALGVSFDEFEVESPNDGMTTITRTPREVKLLLANERNDHPSWSDIAHKIRTAQLGEPRDRDDEDGGEHDTRCHFGHPGCGAC